MQAWLVGRLGSRVPDPPLAASWRLQTFKVDLANTKQIMESPAGQEVG